MKTTTTIKQNPERIYVHPKFKEVLKIEAAKHGKDVIKFTQSLSVNDMYKCFNNKTKKGFDFG